MTAPEWIRERARSRPPAFRDDKLNVDPSCAFCVALNERLSDGWGAPSHDELDELEARHGACTCLGV